MKSSSKFDSLINLHILICLSNVGQTLPTNFNSCSTVVYTYFDASFEVEGINTLGGVGGEKEELQKRKSQGETWIVKKPQRWKKCF